MEKRYQVFVSSTYIDLQEERAEVIQALLELDCIPAGMELFPASNDDQWSLIKKVIDECDYYLLIIAGRYGSLSDSGISYTQMEFEYAISTGKPIISFLHKNPGAIIADNCDTDSVAKENLQAFRKLAEKKVIRYWASPQELGSVVSRSMIKLIKNSPAVGWVRSDTVTASEDTTKDLLRLQKENEALKAQLAQISTQAPEGSEGLAQGEDTVGLEFSCHYTQQARHKSISHSLNLTWNQIFIALSPEMLNECSTDKLIIRMNSLLEKHSKGLFTAHAELKTATDFRQFHIKLSSINLIKVQLQALGLIRLSDKKRAIADKHEYWTLTEYGSYKMTQLIALRIVK